jgi:hypothetical protein
MFFINPFIYGGAGGDFESIATVTVGSGGAASMVLDNIPSGYQHLQVRWIGQSNRGTYATDNLWIRVNGDTGSNYAYHELRGDGASAGAFAGATQTKQYVSGVVGTTQQTSNFGAGIIDILDYTSTSKNKTLRVLAGKDNNGTYASVGGYVQVASGLYFATPAAVTSVTLIAENGNWQQHSTAALFGVKAP